LLIYPAPLPVNLKARVAEFGRWLRGRPERLVVLVGHAAFWHEFLGGRQAGAARLHNAEVVARPW
jgi:hypothetical protein